VRSVWIACLLGAFGACGTPSPLPVTPVASTESGDASVDVPADASIDATIDAAPDAAELHVGAVPVPGEYDAPAQDQNLLDRSVDIAQLPGVNAKWRQRKTLPYRGQVMIALSEAHHEMLAIHVVDTVTETPSGYPGTLWTLELAAAVAPAKDGNAYSPRDVKGETNEYVGPIMFAIRTLPRERAPESERRQYVVYTVKRSVLVAEKLVTDTTWTPRLRIDLPRATKFGALDPGWH